MLSINLISLSRDLHYTSWCITDIILNNIVVCTSNIIKNNIVYVIGDGFRQTTNTWKNNFKKWIWNSLL